MNDMYSNNELNDELSCSRSAPSCAPSVVPPHLSARLVPLLPAGGSGMWRDSYATQKYLARGRIFFWEEFVWMASFFVRWHYMYGELRLRAESCLAGRTFFPNVGDACAMRELLQRRGVLRSM